MLFDIFGATAQHVLQEKTRGFTYWFQGLELVASGTLALICLAMVLIGESGLFLIGLAASGSYVFVCLNKLRDHQAKLDTWDFHHRMHDALFAAQEGQCFFCGETMVKKTGDFNQDRASVTLRVPIPEEASVERQGVVAHQICALSYVETQPTPSERQTIYERARDLNEGIFRSEK